MYNRPSLLISLFYIVPCSSVCLFIHSASHFLYPLAAPPHARCTCRTSINNSDRARGKIKSLSPSFPLLFRCSFYHSSLSLRGILVFPVSFRYTLCDTWPLDSPHFPPSPVFIYPLTIRLTLPLLALDVLSVLLCLFFSREAVPRETDHYNRQQG